MFHVLCVLTCFMTGIVLWMLLSLLDSVSLLFEWVLWMILSLLDSVSLLYEMLFYGTQHIRTVEVQWKNNCFIYHIITTVTSTTSHSFFQINEVHHTISGFELSVWHTSILVHVPDLGVGIKYAVKTSYFHPWLGPWRIFWPIHVRTLIQMTWVGVVYNRIHYNPIWSTIF